MAQETVPVCFRSADSVDGDSVAVVVYVDISSK